ncbi:hypothetical protein T261_4351 [Streptomyces lydicus]|nr:hypothetical protein T261_4351 [Streptomyces lydicus]
MVWRGVAGAPGEGLLPDFSQEHLVDDDGHNVDRRSLLGTLGIGVFGLNDSAKEAAEGG